MMRNKYISLIIFANVFWSFIPVAVTPLFEDVSILMIVFLRFLVSGIIFFVIAMIFPIACNRYSPSCPISHKLLFNFVLSRNNDFFKMRNIVYLAILGFCGIVLQLIMYFLALKLTTISLAVTGFAITIIIVAFYQHGAKSEKLDVFKGLYVLILIVSVFIIFFVKMQEGTEINPNGIIYIVIFSISLSIFQIAVKKDSYSKEEIKVLNGNKYYKMARLFMKISITLLLGVALMFPFILIITFLPFQTDLTQEIELFFSQFSELHLIMFRWEISFLIFGATIIPYFLVFWAAIKWSNYSLTFSQWNTILTIIEPIGSIAFGVFLLNEFFPVDYLLIVIFLLVVSILLRYVHETQNKINAYLLIKRNRQSMKDLPLKLLKLNGVIGVNSLIGAHDLLVNVRSSSIVQFQYLVYEDLRKMEEISEIKILFINKIHKLNI